MLRLYVKSWLQKAIWLYKLYRFCQKETWWSGPVALDANGNLFILSDEDSNAHAPTHDLLSDGLDCWKLSKGHKSCPLICWSAFVFQRTVICAPDDILLVNEGLATALM